MFQRREIVGCQASLNFDDVFCKIQKIVLCCSVILEWFSRKNHIQKCFQLRGVLLVQGDRETADPRNIIRQAWVAAGTLDLVADEIADPERGIALGRAGPFDSRVI